MKCVSLRTSCRIVLDALEEFVVKLNVSLDVQPILRTLTVHEYSQLERLSFQDNEKMLLEVYGFAFILHHASTKHEKSRLFLKVTLGCHSFEDTGLGID